MTDAPTTALTTTEDGKPTFVIVPTLEGFLEMAGRLDHLEANQPATGGSDIDDDGLAAVNDRIDRHRAEIEEIKKRYNGLILYLDSIFNGTTPTATPQPASMVSSQDTIQPQQRRDLIQ